MIFWLAALLGVLLGIALAVLFRGPSRIEINSAIVCTELIHAILEQPNTTDEQQKYWDRLEEPIGTLIAECREELKSM